MIYCPITRAEVEIIARFPPQTKCYMFGEVREGIFRFVKILYGKQLPGFKGGYPVGTTKEVNINNLVADGGAQEIETAYAKTIELPR